MADALSDGFVRATLRRYAQAADGLLQDPDSWADDDATGGGLLGRLRRLPERVVSASPEKWAAMSVDDRIDWWLRRISAVAAPVAATPRIFGLAADRLPLQAAFGAAAQGLAVCAVAREHGRENPDEWVPLLARVLMDRDLPDDVPEEAPADPDAVPPVRENVLKRGGRAMWGLARLLYGLYGAFDGRPRGPWAYRAIGKVPLVGLLGGVMDERSGVRKAAEETKELLLRPAVNDE